MPKGSFRAITLASVLMLLAACAATTQVTRTYSADAFDDSSFGNFLVIAVAGDYSARAQFERTVVSGLRSRGASATAYYSVIKGNKPISSESVLAAVKTADFDAILVTRVIGQELNVNVQSGSTETKASAIGGSALNFFRYNYEELNEPEIINFNTTVVLGTELFTAADETMIWAIESSSADQAIVGVLIENIAGAIVSRLDQDGLIGK